MIMLPSVVTGDHSGIFTIYRDVLMNRLNGPRHRQQGRWPHFRFPSIRRLLDPMSNGGAVSMIPRVAPLLSYCVNLEQYIEP